MAVRRRRVMGSIGGMGRAHGAEVEVEDWRAGRRRRRRR